MYIDIDIYIHKIMYKEIHRKCPRRVSKLQSQKCTNESRQGPWLLAKLLYVLSLISRIIPDEPQFAIRGRWSRA